MKVAVIGSRNLKSVDIGKYIPASATVIVSGGAVGVDTCAKEYAEKRGLEYIEFLPQYKTYGRAAPIVRNRQIADYADIVVAFWDGCSKGSEWMIKYCISNVKQCIIVYVKEPFISL